MDAGASPFALDGTGGTALHRAGSGEVVLLLLGAGGDLEAKTTEGNTPLLIAAMFERTKVVRELSGAPSVL